MPSASPSTLTKTHQKHHLGLAAVPNHTTETMFWHDLPLTSAPGTLLDAQRIGMNVFSVTATAR